MALTKVQKTGLGILGTLAAIFGIRRLARAAPLPWCCPYCPLCFAAYGELVEHVKTAHLGERIPIPIDWD